VLKVVLITGQEEIRHPSLSINNRKCPIKSEHIGKSLHFSDLVEYKHKGRIN
jgi:hypothetical protein